MKAQFNLRSTLANTTAWQRGSAALAALALMALIGALLINNLRPSAQSIPTAPVSFPANRGNNVPITGTGSAYDGGHYAGPLPVRHASPNLPVIGTGSAYDGDHYAFPATRTSSNLPMIGTGSAYDGGHYGSAAPAGNATVQQPGFGTGSVYNGGN